MNLLILLSFWIAAFANANGSSEIFIYGNHIYDDAAILKIAGIDYPVDLSALEMQHKLETTGYFSRVRVTRNETTITIVVREKTPWFLFPYFNSDSNKKIYGIAGGMMGLNGGQSMIIGRGQMGGTNRAASFLFRDEFFLESFWILGASFDYEKADHDVFAGRDAVARVPNKSANFTLQAGYHLQPDLIVEFDTHIEQHKFEESPGNISSGMQLSHRIFAEYGAYYLNEGLARGVLIKPYFEFTNPWSRYQFYQFGMFAQKSAYLQGDFNWITRPRFEYGAPLPFYQRFELGGAKLRGFPSQIFRAEAYSSVQNDFLLTSWDLGKIKIRPILFADFAYVENGGRSGVGGGLQVYFRQVAVPAIQIYGGYGFHPNGFALSAAIGPQI